MPKKRTAEQHARQRRIAARVRALLRAERVERVRAETMRRRFLAGGRP